MICWRELGKWMVIECNDDTLVYTKVYGSNYIDMFVSMKILLMYTIHTSSEVKVIEWRNKLV